jgi:hypothetical protein
VSAELARTQSIGLSPVAEDTAEQRAHQDAESECGRYPADGDQGEPNDDRRFAPGDVNDRAAQAHLRAQQVRHDHECHDGREGRRQHKVAIGQCRREECDRSGQDGEEEYQAAGSARQSGRTGRMRQWLTPTAQNRLPPHR